MSHNHPSDAGSCREVFARLSAYLDGELNAKGLALVQAHIRECAQCRETFAAELEFLELVRDCARSRRGLTRGS